MGVDVQKLAETLPSFKAQVNLPTVLGNEGTSALHAVTADRYVPEVWRKTPEQLWADVLWQDVLKSRGSDVSSGVFFARKMEAAGLTLSAKDEARRRVLYSLSAKRFPNLRVLTLPGLSWRFEKMLLDNREGCQTSIFAIERDPAIYFGSIKFMPEAENGITQKSPHCISTSAIEYYYFTSAESFITDAYCPEIDAAWFDFNGQLTIPIYQAIRRFWQRPCVKQMTITSLNGRWHTETNARIKRYGGLAKWLAHAFRSDVVDEFRYDDGAPMIQIAFERF